MLPIPGIFINFFPSSLFGQCLYNLFRFWFLNLFPKLSEIVIETVHTIGAVLIMGYTLTPAIRWSTFPTHLYSLPASNISFVHIHFFKISAECIGHITYYVGAPIHGNAYIWLSHPYMVLLTGCWMSSRQRVATTTNTYSTWSSSTWTRIWTSSYEPAPRREWTRR